MLDRPHISRLAGTLAMQSLLKPTLAWVTAIWLVTGASMSPPQRANELNQLIEQFNELQRAGKYSDAIPVAEQILGIQQSQPSANQPAVATWLSNLGELYRRQGRLSDAEPLFQQALAIRESTLPADRAGVGGALNGLAMLYQSQGRYG